MLLALRVVYPAFVDSLEEGGKHGVFRTVSDHLWKIWTEVVAANKNKTLKWTSVGVPGFNDMHELKNAVKSMDPINDVLLSYITTYVGVLEFYSTEALHMCSKIQSMSGSTLESELVEFNSMMNRQVTNNLCNRTNEEQVKTKLAGSGIIEDTDSQQEKPSTPHKQAKGKRPTGRQQLYRSPKKKKTASDDVQGSTGEHHEENEGEVTRNDVARIAAACADCEVHQHELVLLAATLFLEFGTSLMDAQTVKSLHRPTFTTANGKVLIDSDMEEDKVWIYSPPSERIPMDPKLVAKRLEMVISEKDGEQDANTFVASLESPKHGAAREVLLAWGRTVCYLTEDEFWKAPVRHPRHSRA